MSAEKIDAGSQTLARGLTALEIIGASDAPLSVAELCSRLGIHRSMAYRLVKTLEQHGFVERDPSGGLVLGTKLSTLARGVAKSLQAAAAPELEAIAEQLQMTAMLVTFDGESAVTLSTAEPQKAGTTVARKPGSRHAIDRGAPGRVLRSQVEPGLYPPKTFEFSQDEVLPGVASVAVPLVIAGAQPAALAVLYFPREVDAERIAQVLAAAAERVIAAVGG
jgi:DNA-binding IclR family transcriptional regulator